jgi:hypothetical protein
MKMEDALVECIILLLPSKTKAIRAFQSCFACGRQEIRGIHGTQVTSPIVQIPGRKACGRCPARRHISWQKISWTERLRRITTHQQDGSPFTLCIPPWSTCSSLPQAISESRCSGCWKSYQGFPW